MVWIIRIPGISLYSDPAVIEFSVLVKLTIKKSIYSLKVE